VDQTLAGIRALDLSQGIAGPFCARLLADYGADVVKVEPTAGDGSRRLGPFPGDVPHPERSGFFRFLNANKRGITLDVRSATGGALFRQLATAADVVVESFGPGVMAEVGLGYEELCRLSPRLVLVSVSPFGQDGPYSRYQATELITFALGGQLYSSGDESHPPAMFAGPQSQLHAGLTAAVATMGAVLTARFHGQGQHVDVSAMEAVSNVVEMWAMRYPYSGDYPARTRMAAGNYPWDIYPCADGSVCLCVNNRQWPRVGPWIGRPDLAEDPSLRAAAARLARYEELDAILVPWLLERSMAEIVRSGQRQRVPVIGVYTPREILADAHFRARGALVAVEDPCVGPLALPGAPFRLGASPWQLRCPAPGLGEHNLQILGGELGRSRLDLVRLRQLGVI